MMIESSEIKFQFGFACYFGGAQLPPVGCFRALKPHFLPDRVAGGANLTDLFRDTREGKLTQEADNRHKTLIIAGRDR